MKSETTTFCASAKHLGGLLKTTFDIRDSVKLNDVILEAQKSLIEIETYFSSVRERNEALAEENSKLKQQIAESENWSSSSSNYRLAEIRPNLFVYEFIWAESYDSPAHLACPRCFTDKTLTILQQPKASENLVRCTNCTFQYDPRINNQENADNQELCNQLKTTHADIANQLQKQFSPRIPRLCR